MKNLKKLALGTLIALALPAMAESRVEKETFSITIDDKLGKGEVVGTITTKGYEIEKDYFEDKTLKIVRKSSDGKQLWQVQDFVKECPVETTLQLLRPILITDADANDMNEVWMIYKLACRGDVSPAEMKIIMYEGTTKYAIRGNMQIKGFDPQQLSEEEKAHHTADANMKNAHEHIREFAEDLWKNYELEFMP